MKYVVTQNRDGAKVYGPSSWTARLAQFMGLTGNAAPPAPFDNGEHTLREVVTDRAVLLDYQEAQDDAGVLDGGVWRVTQSAVDILLDQAAQLAKHKACEKYREVSVGDIDVDGNKISTSTEARAEIAAVKERGRANQKVVTRAGTLLTLTPAATDALLSAVDTHREAASDRYYDLVAAIDSATDLKTLRAIDINSGWPAVVE